MVSEKIISAIKSHIQHEITGSQAAATELISSFLLSREQKIMIIRGYAGTGKTTLIGAITRALDGFRIKQVLMAPTGRAAKVLSSFTGKPAYTIHKKIYRQKTDKDGFGEFLLDRNLHAKTVFIVDESSMISNEGSEGNVFGSGHLLDDLLSYVFNDKNCRLILVGDTAQLPPVGLELSPALTANTLPLYTNRVVETELREVVRQSEDSGILANATTIRENIENNRFELPTLKISGYDDIEQVSGNDLLEALGNSYDSAGLENTILVCRTNKRANLYNDGIRKRILWREEELNVGDYLMVVKNNYFWTKNFPGQMEFIANGDIVEVVKIHQWEEMYNHRFVTATLRFIDYHDVEIKAKIMLDTLMIESASMTYEDNKQFFQTVSEDYTHIGNARERLQHIRENEHFNALQVKFAYAVTCHKAQGGQWKHVYIDLGYLNEDMINREYLRWLYTAFTRATEKLFLINFPEKYFEIK